MAIINNHGGSVKCEISNNIEKYGESVNGEKLEIRRRKWREKKNKKS